MTYTFKTVRLARHCEGLPQPADFEIQSEEIELALKPGRFLVEHLFNSVDPGTRSRLSGLGSYNTALPIGSPIDGFNVGRVIESENEDYPVGTEVFCAGGWRSHSVQSGRGFIGKIPAIPGIPLSYWIGVLGVPGLTAWFGLKEIGGFKAGDNVLVTSAAGPVGATAGQIAKAGGAGKVVGIAGSDTKCDWLVKEAGFDAAINYKTSSDLTADIAAAFPEGIDLLFDNVGNAMINRCLPLMNLFGRICVSGQVADYNLTPEETPGITDTRHIIGSRLTIRGLVAFDHAKDFPKAFTGIGEMIAGGTLAVKEDRFKTIESMPEAFCGLFRGENFGRRVVEL